MNVNGAYVVNNDNIYASRKMKDTERAENTLDATRGATDQVKDILTFINQGGKVSTANTVLRTIEGLFGSTGQLTQISELVGLYNENRERYREQIRGLQDKVLSGEGGKKWSTDHQTVVDTMNKFGEQYFDTDIPKDAIKDVEGYTLQDVYNNKLSAYELEKVTTTLLPLLSGILTYQVAMAVQGGTGGRTISDQDYIIIRNALSLGSWSSTDQIRSTMIATQRFLEKRYITNWVIAKYGKKGYHQEILDEWLGPETGLYDLISGDAMQAQKRGRGEDTGPLPFMKILHQNKLVGDEEVNLMINTLKRSTGTVPKRFTPITDKTGKPVGIGGLDYKTRTFVN